MKLIVKSYVEDTREVIQSVPLIINKTEVNASLPRNSEIETSTNALPSVSSTTKSLIIVDNIYKNNSALSNRTQKKFEPQEITFFSLWTIVLVMLTMFILFCGALIICLKKSINYFRNIHGQSTIRTSWHYIVY